MKNHVCHFRKKQDIRQKDLALLVGIAVSTLSEIEHEKTRPSLTVALKISKALKKPVEELFLLPTDIVQVKQKPHKSEAVEVITNT